MACLTQDGVLAFLSGGLDEAASRAVDEHMDGCAACRRLVVESARASRPQARSSAAPGSHVGADESGAAAVPFLVPGSLVSGRFRILRRVGRGAMGVVFEAEDQRLETRVALKVLPTETSAMPGMLDRLRQEVILGRRVTHPNVCRLHDFGESDGHSYITMEFVDGVTLTERLREGPLDPSVAHAVLDQICAAVEAAHAHGVIHRDLKPTNIMIDAAGRVSVMDFGLARDLHAERSESGALVGTPAYWSPEQARGAAATERSDVYTLGVIAAELFGAPRPAWSEARDLAALPPDVVAVVERCLRLEPAERWPSVTALRAAFAAASGAGGPVRRRPRRRFLVLTGAAGLAAGVLGTWALVRSADPPRLPASGDAGGARRAGASSLPARAAADQPRGAHADAGRLGAWSARVRVRVVPATAVLRTRAGVLGVGAGELVFEAGTPPVEVTAAAPGFRARTVRVRAGDAPELAIVLERGVAPARSQAGADAGRLEAGAPSMPFFE